jgi:hypothetical protein
VLPGGRTPRGSFTWPRAASFAESAGATPALESSPALAGAQIAANAAPGTPLWGAMRPLVQVSPSESAAPSAGRAPSGRGASPAASSAQSSAERAARPLLEVIRGGLSPVEPGPAAREAAMRYSPVSQPLVSAQAQGPAAQSIVQAVRHTPPTAPSDDRITLADLTLISVASSQQQVAASPEGSAPAPESKRPQEAPGPASSGKAGASGHGPPNPEEIASMANQVYDAWQLLRDIQRERSGDPWES